MTYTNEVKEILENLCREVSPGKTISAVDVILRIMTKYYNETGVEDLNVVIYVKNHLQPREMMKDLIEDLISYCTEYDQTEHDRIDYKGYPFDASMYNSIKAAEKESSDKAFYPIPMISTFHLMLGILKTETKVGEIFDNYGVGYDVLAKSGESNKGFYDKMLDIATDAVQKLFPQDSHDSFDPEEFLESIGFPGGEESSTEKKPTKTPMLDKYARDMASENLDPIYGRDSELSQLLEILGCKKKNNAILIGEAGVGKTSVVELLAQKIKSGDVPKAFKNKRIYNLNLNSLVAGTKYRGQYEERLQGIIEEVLGNPDIIIFIDEIHGLIGNGGSDGNGDAANILKPYLSKGVFQCIGSTTFKEYRKYIESDAALKRRFQTIIINEPSTEETKVILKNIKSTYEGHHNVIYPKEVLDACVELSGRYLYSSKFPDKAIDALDLSGSLCNLDRDDTETKKIEKEIQETQDLKNKAVGKKDFQEAITHRDKEETLKKNLTTLNKPIKVTLGDVYKAIGKRSGVPIDTIGSSDLEKLRKLSETLNKEVIGQEKAVKEIVMGLQKNSLSIRDKSKPISLLFTGPTGCGKTYLCKMLASEFFGSQDSLIRFDMGEFEEKHSISKLTGATASYVGYDDEPLFEKIRHNPYSVVLFDEIEKAAPEIFQIFLNILDEGYVTLGNGVKVDFRHTIIIFTGNIGTKELSLFGGGLGYGQTKVGEKLDETRKDGIIMKAIEKTFAPEFINRLSKIIIFSDLGKEELKKIINLEITKLSGRLKESKISIKVSEGLKNHIISLCNTKFGARDLQRKISELIEEKLCETLLLPDTPEGKKIYNLDYKDGEVKINLK